MKISIEKILDEQIQDYHDAENKVYPSHWLSLYFRERKIQKIKKYKELIGREYDMNRLKKIKPSDSFHRHD